MNMTIGQLFTTDNSSGIVRRWTLRLSSDIPGFITLVTPWTTSTAGRDYPQSSLGRFSNLNWFNLGYRPPYSFSDTHTAEHLGQALGTLGTMCTIKILKLWNHVSYPNLGTRNHMSYPNHGNRTMCPTLNIKQCSYVLSWNQEPCVVGYILNLGTVIYPNHGTRTMCPILILELGTLCPILILELGPCILSLSWN